MMRGIRLSALLIALSVDVVGCERVPTQLSQVTWDALQDSRRQGAEAGAPDVWSVAKARFDSAWIAIEAQNRLWFFERDFEPAESLLVWSGRTAREAVKAAYNNRERQRQIIDSTIVELAKDVEAHRLGLNGHIARIPLRRALTEAEVMVENVRAAYAAGDIDKAFTAIE